MVCNTYGMLQSMHVSPFRIVIDGGGISTHRRIVVLHVGGICDEEPRRGFVLTPTVVTIDRKEHPS
jgi:hypothetical protein